jgi:multidrug transporter EmrE-like cation transporter
MLLISFVFTVFCQTSYILQLFTATHLDASIIYPMLTGINSVSNIIFAYFVFKEGVNKRTIIASIIIIIGVVLFII